MKNLILDRPRKQRGLSRRGLITGTVGLAMSAALPATALAARPLRSTPIGKAPLVPAPSESVPLVGQPDNCEGLCPEAGEAANAVRTIGLANINTGERLDTVYWQAGAYVDSAVTALNTFMRDWRNDEITDIDPALFDMLWMIGGAVGQDPEFTMLSGYRSRSTNEMMIGSGRGGIARNSMHIQGRAIDIEVPGLPAAQLRDAALALQAGGVGYYPHGNFVHLDTGQVRSWHG